MFEHTQTHVAARNRGKYPVFNLELFSLSLPFLVTCTSRENCNSMECQLLDTCISFENHGFPLFPLYSFYISHFLPFFLSYFFPFLSPLRSLFVSLVHCKYTDIFLNKDLVNQSLFTIMDSIV